MSEEFIATLDAYVKAFGDGPLHLHGVTDELLLELMREAVQLGRRIPEGDYYRYLPPDALA